MMVGAGLGQQVGPWGAHPAAQPAQAPPPLPGSGRRYHVAVASNPAGPFPVEELRARAQVGQLERSTLVWSEGMAQWQAAAEVEELKPLFAAVPPPLPGAG
jgi:hypothetical protein